MPARNDSDAPVLVMHGSGGVGEPAHDFAMRSNVGLRLFHWLVAPEEALAAASVRTSGDSTLCRNPPNSESIGHERQLSWVTPIVGTSCALTAVGSMMTVVVDADADRESLVNTTVNTYDLPTVRALLLTVILGVDADPRMLVMPALQAAPEGIRHDHAKVPAEEDGSSGSLDPDASSARSCRMMCVRGPRPPTTRASSGLATQVRRITAVLNHVAFLTRAAWNSNEYELPGTSVVPAGSAFQLLEGLGTVTVGPPVCVHLYVNPIPVSYPHAYGGRDANPVMMTSLDRYATRRVGDTNT